MRLWCYRDYRDWGDQLLAAALARGHDARMFTAEQAGEIEGGYAFIHAHHHPEVRERDKRAAEIVHRRGATRLIPFNREIEVYDDKVRQRSVIGDFLPRTHVFTDRDAAMEFAGTHDEWPVVSKSSEGAGSHNVRLLRNPAAAMEEIRQVFCNGGARLHYGERQTGYVYWQEFLPQNQCDFRVIRVGENTLLLKRFIRSSHRPFASGSGRNVPVNDLYDEAAMQATNAAWAFFTLNDFRFCGVDVVFDRTGSAKILECTVGWTLDGYRECKFLESDRKGSEFWDEFLDQVEQGAFD